MRRHATLPTPGAIADRNQGRAEGRLGAGSHREHRDPALDALVDVLVGSIPPTPAR